MQMWMSAGGGGVTPNVDKWTGEARCENTYFADFLYGWPYLQYFWFCTRGHKL